MVENMKTNQLINGGTWTTYTPPAWPKIFQQTGAYPTVSCIVESLDGTLWFGTRGSEEPGAGAQGVFRFDGKTWTHFRVENGLPFDEITSMAVSPDGVIWFGGYGVARYDGKSWTTYTTDNGLASDDIRSIAYAPDGTLWIGSSDKGLMRFDGKGWQYFLQQYNDNYIGHIFILPDNSLLFSYSYGFSAELIRFDGRNWTNDPTPWTEHGKYAVDIASAPNGDLWFATEFMGVYRLSQNTWTNYTDKDGLPSDEMITSVAVARDGSVWVGSMNGLSRFDGKTWNTITLQDDTGSQWIGSIFAATDGSVWISYYGGIARFNPATIQ
jgi:ligand-binding sensor domain-containing protein